jgi:hypothetical protein
LFRWWTGSDGHDLDHPDGLRAALREANPGIGASFLDIERLVARRQEIPEHEFRRYYLNQWAARPEQAMPDDQWAACADPEREVEQGTEIVLALDASFRRGSTALLGVTCEPVPHIFVVGIWEQPEADSSWRVPTAEVMAAIVGTARYASCARSRSIRRSTGQACWATLSSTAWRIGWWSGRPRPRPASRPPGCASAIPSTTAARPMRATPVWPATSANLVLRADRHGERPTRDRSQPRI